MILNWRRLRAFAALIVFVTAPVVCYARETTRSRTAQFQGMKLHYADSGHGREALVFIHGWTCNGTFFDLQDRALFQGRRVIALDLPGHGQSDKPRLDYTQDLFAHAVNAVLEHAGVDRAILVGHSMGTPVAREFYRFYPKKVSGMVIVDGMLRQSRPKDVMDKMLTEMDSPAYLEISRPMFLALIGPTMEPTMRDKVLAAMQQTPRHVVISTGRGMYDDEAVYNPDPINVPGLAIMSAASGWPADNEQFYRSVIKDLDYQVWTGTGHFVMMEKADQFNTTLVAFLQKIGFLKKTAARAAASR